MAVVEEDREVVPRVEQTGAREAAQDRL